MNKQDEAKAKEIADGYSTNSNGVIPIRLVKHEIKSSCIEMSAWKEEQMIEKALKWLKENAGMYWYDDICIDCPDELLEDFKKAMTED